MTLPVFVLMAITSAHSLTLEDAIRAADAYQPQIRQAKAKTEAAQAQADVSMAPLLPQVSANGSYQRSTSNFAPRPGAAPRSTSLGASNSFDTYNYFNFGISASQMIYDFGQASGQWRASQSTAEAQRQNEEAARLQIRLNVRTAFFAARAQKELVRVAEETVSNQRRHHAQVQGFVEVKTRPEIDLAQARLDLANAELLLVNSQSNYATARAQLNQAMGVVQGTDYDVADDTAPPIAGEEASTDALMQEALLRPDILAVQKQMDAQQLTIRATKAAYAPSLGVSTSLSEAGAQFTNMAWNWSGAVTLTWPIFQGNQTRSQVRVGEANLTALGAQLETAKLQIRLAIEQARLSIRAAKAGLGLADVALQNAAQRLALAEGRYQAGVGSMIELGDAQLAYTTAGAQKVQAEYALATARAQLLQALGRR